MLNTFGGALDYADDIADFPRIVGASRYSGGPRHAALWDDKKLIDLGTLGGANSFARALVVRAWPDWSFTETYVVGESELAAGPGHIRAFLWNGWSMTDLGTLPGWFGSRAYGINKNLDVVGWVWDTYGGGVHHAVMARRRHRRPQHLDLRPRLGAPVRLRHQRRRPDRRLRPLQRPDEGVPAGAVTALDPSSALHAESGTSLSPLPVTFCTAPVGPRHQAPLAAGGRKTSLALPAEQQVLSRCCFCGTQ